MGWLNTAMHAAKTVCSVGAKLPHSADRRWGKQGARHMHRHHCSNQVLVSLWHT